MSGRDEDRLAVLERSTSKRDRPLAEPESLVLDDDDGPTCEFRPTVVDHLKESQLTAAGV